MAHRTARDGYLELVDRLNRHPEGASPSDVLCRILEMLFSEREADGATSYVLPPPMAGFFGFSMMRVRGDLDQQLLSELFYEHMNVEEQYIRSLFTDGETQLGRADVSEPSLPTDGALHVLDFERASHVVESASDIGVGL
jgi:hypothetical protein